MKIKKIILDLPDQSECDSVVCAGKMSAGVSTLSEQPDWLTLGSLLALRSRELKTYKDRWLGAFD